MRSNPHTPSPAPACSLISAWVPAAFALLLWAALSTPALGNSCSGIPDEECDALYALYYSTGGDEWADNTNWLSAEPVWTWHGITFGAGNVMGINLGGNGLTGTIPAELVNFSNLWTLSLGYNRIGGSIPPELGSLPRLRLLSLSGNNLSGLIPPELGRLAELERLGLAYNNLTGPIPPELGGLAQLERLELHENRLSGPIPPELGNLTGLSIFMLRNNQLTGTIPPELRALADIDHLDLSRNKLSGEIPPELGTMSWLRSLNLSFNCLSGPIPEELGNLPDLSTFHLNSNNLSGPLPSFLATPVNTWIDLRYNRLYASGSAVLSQMEAKHQGKFLSTQTLPPENITAVTIEDSGNPENRVQVSWSPIKYVDDQGGYQVFYSRTGEEDFHYGGMTEDKNTACLTVSNLEPGVDFDFRVKSVTWNHAWNGNSLYSEESNAAAASAGNTHRAFIPVWKQSPDYFTGVVASNFGNEGFNLALTAWDASGQKEPLGTNPAVCAIGPSRQESLLGVEFFNGSPNHTDFSWIELVVENSRDLGSIFLFGAKDTQMLDGAEAQYRHARKLYFTRPLDEKFFEGWDPDIQMCIVNPTDQEVRVICWLRGSSRVFGQSHTIPARGFVTGNARELVPLHYDVTSAYMEIEVTEGPGVAGFSRIEFPGVRTALGMNAVEAHQAEKMYSAQLAHGAGIVTNLQLVNTYPALRNVKLTLIADDGSLLAAAWVAMPGEKIYNANLGTLFGLDPEGGIITGSLIVESFGKGVIGDIIFADGDTLEYAMSLPLQTELFREAVFNHISNLETVFTGFAFFNPGDETANVLIEAIGTDGSKVAEKTLILGPGERIARTLTDPDMWPEFPTQSGGYIKIQSDQPIAGQQLFGDRSLRYMAAVPPTTRAEAMFE